MFCLSLQSLLASMDIKMILETITKKSGQTVAYIHTVEVVTTNVVSKYST